MEQAEISIESKKLQAEIQEYKDQIEILRLKLGQIQRRCKHPNDQRYSAQGEVGWHCPDCGRQT